MSRCREENRGREGRGGREQEGGKEGLKLRRLGGEGWKEEEDEGEEVVGGRHWSL